VGATRQYLGDALHGDPSIGMANTLETVQWRSGNRVDQVRYRLTEHHQRCQRRVRYSR
jgi:hypothetical protein